MIGDVGEPDPSTAAAVSIRDCSVADPIRPHSHRHCRGAVDSVGRDREDRSGAGWTRCGPATINLGLKKQSMARRRDGGQLADFSYQARTRRARSVFHLLGR